MKKSLPRIFELKTSLKNPILVQHGTSLGPCFGFEDIHILSNMSDIHTYYNGSFNLLKNTNGTMHPLSGRNENGRIQQNKVDRFQAYKIEVFQLVIQK